MKLNPTEKRKRKASPKSKKPWKWKTAIKQIVQNCKEEKIVLKEVRRKVIAEFRSQAGNASFSKAECKEFFALKLRSTAAVEVDGKYLKLVEKSKRKKQKV